MCKKEKLTNFGTLSQFLNPIKSIRIVTELISHKVS